jgi:polysaccharide chain length determinant protein (PEP-CTERM system associated)
MRETELAIFPDEAAAAPSPRTPPPAQRTPVRQFIEAPLRRPLVVVLPLVGVLALAVAASFLLPKKYKSSTLILVEWEKVPESFLPRGRSEEGSNRRLLTLQPEILSRTRLERVIAETAPYPNVRSTTGAVEEMRKDIVVKVRSSDVFTIEFVHSDPRKTQEVTQRLATLFIEESANAREQQVEEALAFLVQQVDEAGRQLETKETALRRYKEQRMGQLPEQLQANLATLQMLQEELRGVEDNLRATQQQRDQLALTSAGEGRPVGIPVDAGGDLAQLRSQLIALRGRYTEEHPDVQALKARIARLETQRSEAASRGGLASIDPATAAAQQQLARTESEIKTLEARRQALENKAATFRARVELAPRSEQELATLMRDYQKLNENYLTLLNKKLGAEMTTRLERRWKGERFRILDPAHLPDRPFSPNVPLLLVAGAFLGLVVGVGASVAMEYSDPTIKSTEDLQALLPHPVLARVPRLSRPSAAR